MTPSAPSDTPPETDGGSMNENGPAPDFRVAPAKRASPSVMVSGCSGSPVSIHNYPDGALPKAPFPRKLTEATDEEWNWTRNLLAISESHEKRIQAESGWLGQRMTWLVISQSFLFGAFATVAIRTAVFQTPDPANALITPPLSPDSQMLPILALLIAFVALIQAVAVFVSIWAAHRVHLNQAELRGTIDAWIKEYAVPREFYVRWPNLGPRGRWWNYGCGAAASWLIPVTLVCVWLLLILYMLLPGFNAWIDAVSQSIITAK